MHMYVQVHVHRLLQYNIIYTSIEKICRQCQKIPVSQQQRTCTCTMLALSSSVLFVSYGRYVAEELNKISLILRCVIKQATETVKLRAKRNSEGDNMVFTDSSVNVTKLHKHILHQRPLSYIIQFTTLLFRDILQNVCSTRQTVRLRRPQTQT